MDQPRELSRQAVTPSSSSIVNFRDHNPEFEGDEVEWDGNAEEIELGDQLEVENCLFLDPNDASSRLANNGSRASARRETISSSPNGSGPEVMPSNRSHEDNEDVDLLFDDNDDGQIESIQLLQQGKQVRNADRDDHDPTLPPSCIVYRAPNFQQFAGNLAPSSPASVLVSLIIITVILCVTIFPIIFLPQKAINDNSIDNVIEQRINSKAKDAQQIVHSDFRCKCVCPPEPIIESKNKNNSTTTSASKSNNNKTQEARIDGRKRRLYVGNTSPDKCNCNNIVQPHLTNNRILLKDFCFKCECRYQSRNTTTIRRNVIFFILVLFILGLYTLIQYLLKYFRITKRHIPRQFRWLLHQISEND